MGTYKDLQDRINNYLNRDLGENTKNAIQDAIRDREAERGWYNETSTALVCVALQPYVPPPSDFWDLDRLEVRISNQQIALVETSFDTIRVMNSTGQPGQPTHYNYRADKWWLTMIPDSAYALMCYYVHKIPVLVADNDSNVWTNEGFNFIKHEATLDLMANTLQVDDPTKLQSQRIKRDEALDKFMERVSQRMTTTLRATRF